jgi:hypothetical protein
MSDITITWAKMVNYRKPNTNDAGVTDMFDVTKEIEQLQQDAKAMAEYLIYFRNTLEGTPLKSSQDFVDFAEKTNSVTEIAHKYTKGEDNG